MKDFEKYKADMGDDYEYKVKQIAKSKDVQDVNKVFPVCDQLEFDHKPGPCTRANKVENSKYSADQIAEIKEHVMNDVVQAIIEETKANLIENEQNINLKVQILWQMPLTIWQKC